MAAGRLISFDEIWGKRLAAAFLIGALVTACNGYWQYYFGFEEMKLHRIEARFIQENERSLHVMEKVGMTFEGVMREGMLIKGNYVNVGICSILASEWRGHDQ